MHNFNSIDDCLDYSLATHWTSLEWKWHTWTLNICFFKAFVIEIESFLMHFHLFSLTSLGRNFFNLVAWLLLLKFLIQYQFDLIFFQVFFFMAKKGLITQLSWQMILTLQFKMLYLNSFELVCKLWEAHCLHIFSYRCYSSSWFSDCHCDAQM